MTSHLLKAEIHCHLEGAAPPALVVKQAEKYGIDKNNPESIRRAEIKALEIKNGK